MACRSAAVAIVIAAAAVAGSRAVQIQAVWPGECGFVDLVRRQKIHAIAGTQSRDFANLDSRRGGVARLPSAAREFVAEAVAAA